MKRLMKFGLALAALAFVVPAFVIQAAQAQTTQSFTATATVASSLTITENTPLSFGSLVVIQDGTNAPEATLAANGTFTVTTPTGTENMVQTGTPTPGNFTVDTGVTSFVNVEVTFPASTTLANVTAPPTNGTFTVDTFTVAAPTAGAFTGTTATLAACNTAISGGGDCQFTTGGTGTLTFAMGAMITVGSATASYIDGSYTGSYDLTAAFF